MGNERVTKIQAAERQLNAAIYLFFKRFDIIAVHALASASRQILHDLAKQKGISGMILNSSLIREEKKKEWNRIVKGPENFLKHADRDSYKELAFSQDVTEFTILDAVDMHRKLELQASVEINVFLTWFTIRYPDLLLDSEIKKSALEKRASGLNPNNFEALVHLIERNKVT